MKDLLTFSRRQRIGIITLLLLILFTLSIQILFPRSTQTTVRHKNFEEIISLLERADSVTSENQINVKPLTPFTFNPNTLDKSGFIKLGLHEKIASRIINYREKGGHFYKKESFQKIWGLTPSEYNQLAPFMDIPESKHGFTTPKSRLWIELNEADTTELIKLKGIGSVMAMRIVEYREALGGFVHPSQLLEVYGLHPEVYAMIKPEVYANAKKVKKLNLNTLTFKEIADHPYFSTELTTAIVNYRKEHNYQIQKIEEITSIPLINEEKFRKIAPYITL